MVHYQHTFEEVRAVRYMDRGDYEKHPPMLCKTGDGHAVGSRDWSAVTCPRCLQQRPSHT